MKRFKSEPGGRMAYADGDVLAYADGSTFASPSPRDDAGAADMAVREALRILAETEQRCDCHYYGRITTARHVGFSSNHHMLAAMALAESLRAFIDAPSPDGLS